jgi:thiamine-monophosphate kinase
MTAAEMSERAFLESIRHLVNRIPDSKLGFDEDASDIPLNGTQNVVINVDTFVRESDWLPGMTAAQAGRKAAVMTISDIVAKGASPRATMISLCMPDDYSREDAREMVRGFSQYGLKSGIPFIGGDLGRAKDVILTGIGIGVAPPSGIISRAGTHEGDIIAVTGQFGLTGLAYAHLLRGLELDSNLRYDVLGMAYNPHIHHDFVAALASNGAISASMDSSDGLGITLHTMARLSELAFEVDVIPVSQDISRFAEQRGLNLLQLVMQGGEEFVLVITIPQEKKDLAFSIAGEQKVPLIEIGFAKSGQGVNYRSSEGWTEVPSSGYDSLTGWD